jgi:hypothetical protein
MKFEYMNIEQYFEAKIWLNLLFNNGFHAMKIKVILV